MNKTLQTLLEEHKEAILKEEKSLVIALEDGICTVEKGLDEAPFMIKVEMFDKKLSLTINEFLGIKQ
jgi:hypothetical protein